MVDPVRLRVLLNEHTCASKCMGIAGNRGGCCSLGERDFIIGPIADAEALLAKLTLHWGRPALRAEVLIDHAEGSALFPERPSWQPPEHYPALRITLEGANLPCRFYDSDAARCSIYELRPETCRTFECDWLKHVLEAV